MTNSDELKNKADELAGELGCTRKEAWKRVRAGEFKGTDFAKELAHLMFLLAEDD